MEAYYTTNNKNSPNFVCQTGGYCSMAGMWKIEEQPWITIYMVEGRRFPPHLGRIVIWVPGFLM